MARYTAAVACILLVVGLLPARAQTSSSVETDADRIFHRVMSPYCPGKLLAACGSGQAETLRQEVRRELAAGTRADVIEAELYHRFGDSIRSEPLPSGVGLLAWVVPAAIFTLTGAWLVVWLRRTPRPEAGYPAPAPAVSPQLLNRLDDELLELN